MVSGIEKLKVFISSKMGDKAVDQKYNITRKAMKQLLESTGMFSVYLFEEAGASSSSALDHYTFSLQDCDVCIFLIDNKDGVPAGVQKEIDDANKYHIPSIYYFCNKYKKAITPTQEELRKPHKPKHIEISSFESFLDSGARDLINDILFTYKIFRKKNIELEANTEEIFSDVAQSDSLEILSDSEIHRQESESLLEKSQLEGMMCQNYFSKLIFGKENELVQKQDFDHYASLFLPVLFEGGSVEHFNIQLFLESLESMIPEKYFKVVSKRWMAIQYYYLDDIEKSLELLNEAYTLAESESLTEWFIQDILIDLRNVENRFNETKNMVVIDNFGQKKINNRTDPLFYPVIDRNEKSLLTWIEDDRQKKEMSSYTTQHFMGDMSHLSKYLTNIYLQSVMFGSMTHLEGIYGLIQKLAYELCSFTNYWPWFMLVMKNSILLLDKKKTTQITRHFEELLIKMNSKDAKEIYEYSNNMKPSYLKFRSNLIAMSEVGYYLSDIDFDLYWQNLQSQIDDWIREENSIVQHESFIFHCIKKIHLRINTDYIIEFCAKILTSDKKRYYHEALELLASIVDYNDVSENNNVCLSQIIISLMENKDDYATFNYVKEICIGLGNLSLFDASDVEAALSIYHPDFYNNEYAFETSDEENVYKQFINAQIDIINKRNEEQGKDGQYLGYGSSPYNEILRALIESDSKLEPQITDKVFIATADTILSRHQIIGDKINAYHLLIFLCRYDMDIINRNREIVDLLIHCEDVKKAHDSFISYVNDSVLLIAYLLLIACFGSDVWEDLSIILPLYTDEGSQVMVSKLINTFLYNPDKKQIDDKIENVFFQYCLLWINSKSIDVRWNTVKNLINLFSRDEYKNIISLKLKKCMTEDNAFIKSRIIQQVETIKEFDVETAQSIIESAKIDNNFAIRKIIYTKPNDE